MSYFKILAIIGGIFSILGIFNSITYESIRIAKKML